MSLPQNGRIALVAAVIYLADQATKMAVMKLLRLTDQYILVDGFFKFVHWGNTGAAWSMFRGNNALLAFISFLALLVLLFNRRQFESGTLPGQIALGLIVGGILGNLTDRLRFGYVVDFLYFHLYRRGGGEIGFPAFNVADSAICTGVGLLFIVTWVNETKAKAPPPREDGNPQTRLQQG